jgi:hypothetical protein
MILAIQRISWILALTCGALLLPCGAAAQKALAQVGRLKVTSAKVKPHVLEKGKLIMLAFKAPKGAQKFVVKMRMACSVACKGTMYLSHEKFGPSSTRAHLLLGKRFENSNINEPIPFERPEGFDGGKLGNFFITIVADSGMITLVRSDSPLQLESNEITRSVDLILQGERHLVPTMSPVAPAPAQGIHYEVEAYR